MIRWVLSFAFAATVAQADPVTVRSGEHDTFTRLVFAIEAGTAWTVNPVESGFELRLDSNADGFDLTGVFDRIPRTRLADMSVVSENIVALGVDCTCHTNAYLWRPNRLVVDIFDGPNPSEAPADTAFSAQNQRAALPASSPTMALPDLLDMPRGLTLTTSDADPTPIAPAMAPAVNEPVHRPTNDTEQAETALIETIARAASQGYLETTTEAFLQDKPADVTMDDPTQDDNPIAMDGPVRLGLGVSTALDETLAEIAQSLNSLDATQCLDAETFDLAAWSDGRSLHEQIADLADALAGDFDQPPTDAQTELARLYLHFGFGAEALSVLRSDSATSHTRQILREMARAIDGYDAPFHKLQKQQGCETPGAIWAILAGAQAPTEPELVNTLMRNFFTVPQPVRGHIAPRISQALLDGGWLDEAEGVLRATQTPDVETADDTATAQVNLALERDDTANALTMIASQVRENPHASPENAIRFIDLTLAAGEIPTEEDILNLEGLETEYRSADIHDEILVAISKAHLARGHFEAALTVLGGRLDPAALERIEDVYVHVANTGKPATFLDFAFAPLPDELSDETINLFGKRLTETGFPERALDVLSRPAVREAAAERRYLRADAAIRSRQYISALEAIAGINTPRANALRSAAYEGLGDHESALSAAPVQTQNTPPLTEFRAQAWERLSTSDDSALSAFAQTRLTPEPAQDPVSLADRRSALERSQESRRAIEGLLTRFDGSFDEN